MAMTALGATAAFEPVCDINTTPLIDVMLVLLIMFIITIPIMTHAVKLDMPQSPPPTLLTDPLPEVLDLEIDFDGTVVYNGTVVRDLATLERYFQADAAKMPQPEIHLRPDKRARYDTVAVVMAAAQRNHMRRIGFANMSQFASGD